LKLCQNIKLNWQWKKIWSKDSKLVQKTQEAEPDHPLHNKTSFVNIISCKANQIKFLMLSGIFKFQTEPTIEIFTPRKFKNKYIKCIVKIPVPSNP
jgi:hypothetical protein